MPRWLTRICHRIRALAVTGRVHFTDKALEELRALDLGLDRRDAVAILADLHAGDVERRLRSHHDGELLYVLRPIVAGTPLYVKIALRSHCVVVSTMTRKTTMTTATEGTRPSRRRRRPPAPDDACPQCGTIMKPRVAALRHVVNGERMVVPGIAHLHCGQCGENLLDLEAVDQLWDGAQAAYRARHGLLSGADIRALREHLGLTQAELATLLRLGPNTLSRWEVGRNVQSAAMDLLLRLLRDLPGTLAYLRRRAA